MAAGGSMKLLLFEERIGPERQTIDDARPATNQFVSLATRLSVPEALLAIRSHVETQARDLAPSGLVLEFRLLSVSELDAAEPDLLHSFGVEMLETVVASMHGRQATIAMGVG